MALAVEVAELLEIFQWLTEEQSKEIINKEMSLIGEEIADVVIYLVRLADKIHLDIEKAVLEKIALNEKKYPIEFAKDNATKHNKRWNPSFIQISHINLPIMLPRYSCATP